MTTTRDNLKDLTLEEGIAALKAAVLVRGETFVYPEEEKIESDGDTVCVYTREVDGKTVGSCLIGVALIDVLGMDPAKIDGLNDISYTAMARYGRDDFSLLNRVFREAQRNQDRGVAWGESVEHALDAWATDIKIELAYPDGRV